MTDEQLRDLCEIVISVRDRQVPVIPYMHTLTESFALHEILLNEIFPEILNDSEPQDHGNIKLVAVLNYLARRDAGEIPLGIINDCLGIFGSLDIDHEDDQLLIDVAIALAAGWRRKARIGQSIWDEPWKTAISSLSYRRQKASKVGSILWLGLRNKEGSSQSRSRKSLAEMSRNPTSSSEKKTEKIFTELRFLSGCQS